MLNAALHTAVISSLVFPLRTYVAQDLNILHFTAPMPRESSRTRNLVLEARRVGRNGIPRTATTMFPASVPKWPTQRGAREGRKAKEESKT